MRLDKVKYYNYVFFYFLFISSFAVFLYSIKNKNTLYTILCFIYAIFALPIFIILFILLKFIIIWFNSLKLFIKKV